MGLKEQALLSLQYFFGRLTIIILGPLIIIALKVMRYKVRDIRNVRREVRSFFKGYRGPWLICSNHLTMIDSVILAYAMVPLYRYVLDYHLLPWNLPERANFQRNIFLTVICYLAKCIPVSRGGDRGEMKMTLEKCSYLLRKNEKLLIFPEGGRSRTGRIEPANVSYGVGRFVTENPECKVLCLYLRGDGQETYSNIPRFGEVFTMTVDAIHPSTEQKGLKGQRACAQQIIGRLAEMENEYFDLHRQRHSRLDNFSNKKENPGYALR